MHTYVKVHICTCINSNFAANIYWNAPLKIIKLDTMLCVKLAIWHVSFELAIGELDNRLVNRTMPDRAFR